MNTLPQQLANGLFLGSMYGLIAIGYTMVYGIVQLINFAHGEIFMTGGFGALTVYLYVLPDGTSMWIALPAMLIGGGLVAVLIAVGAERFAYRPLRGAPRLAPLITAIGLSSRSSRPSSTGTRTPRPTATSPDQRRPWHIGSISISSGSLFVIVAAPLCMAALALFVSMSRTGRAMQATAQDPDTAQLMGIDTNKIIVIAFAIGGFFAAVAAVSYGLRYGSIQYNMGFQMGLKAFTAAVLGGIGNIYGAMIGGLVLGLAETMATSYIDGIPGMQQLGGGGWSSVWAFVLLILVLLFRPQGLVGERVADRA